MKKIIFIFVMIFVVIFSYATDLSDFPDSYIADGEFQGYIVVGSSASSSDVILQSELALEVAEYIGSPQFGISVVDSDVELENNLVLIGNPCTNSLTNELLEEPDPCDLDFPSGEAKIIYLESDEYKYIIIAGNDQEGNKAAVETLKNFQEEDLIGEEMVLDVPETIDVDAERQKAIDELLARMDDEEEEIKIIEEDIPEVLVEPEVVVIEDRGFFQKMWDWIKGIFS